jgi:hypothetical protein
MDINITLLKMNKSFMVITPINKNKKSNSNVDYKEQLIRTARGDSIWCWDDSKNNTAKVGEYFGFYFYGIKVIIHRITGVKDSTERLPSWSRNVGQGDRKVLELSDSLFEIDWDTWISIGGAKRCMGTYRTTELEQNHRELYNYLIENEVVIFE